MKNFSWANFNPDFLEAVLLRSKEAEKVKEKIKNGMDEDLLAAYMLSIYDSPDRDFVRTYRRLIETQLFPGYKSEVKKICDALNIQGENYNARQVKLQKHVMSESLVGAYVRALLNISGMDIPITEFSKFKNTVSINLAETPVGNVDLYGFQKDAVNSLTKHFITDDKNKGLLVMPTGSGKSRTATYFLIKEMVSKGYQILWIAHRHMLIDQAADCFYNFAGLSKINNPGIKNYRISCISGEHLTCSMVNKGDEIIVASISSICRNKKHLSRILGQKVMIVVDEAHHTFAPTYRDVIKHIMKTRKESKLLGLTATPVRANENDSVKLLKIFDNSIVYEVSMANLIAKGILADPLFERIETDESFEESIGSYEASYIRRMHELPESVVNRIVESKERNEIILDQFKKNQERYGKTLIFAMNQIHCRLLAEEFNNSGIPCGCVYSGNDDNSRIIKDYKDNKFKVLINVNIMTEGTDVPDIQTVFLTRPTQSEGFLIQMIGRGMRGVNAGGTKTVNIVDFHDKWDVFKDWLNPQRLISQEDEDFIDNDSDYKKYSYEEIEWKLCQEVYHEMAASKRESNTYLAVPYCWYSLYDEDGQMCRIIVFDDQKKGYDELFANKELWTDDDDINADDAKRVLATYFDYFCNRPSERDIVLMLLNLRDNEEFPEPIYIEARELIDPANVALEAENKNIDIFELATQRYDENIVAQDLYETKNNYLMACCQAKIYKNSPVKAGANVEEMPIELIEFDMNPFYDLQTLVDDVVDKMFGGELENDVRVEWTRKPMKSYFGIHYPDHTILINSILNSKDVPVDVIKYVIYHEFIHEDIDHHGAEFRAREHMYPDWEEHDHYLDTMFLKYDIHRAE